MPSAFVAAFCWGERDCCCCYCCCYCCFCADAAVGTSVSRCFLGTPFQLCDDCVQLIHFVLIAAADVSALVEFFLFRVISPVVGESLVQLECLLMPMVATHCVHPWER